MHEIGTTDRWIDPLEIKFHWVKITSFFGNPKVNKQTNERTAMSAGEQWIVNEFLLSEIG